MRFLRRLIRGYLARRRARKQKERDDQVFRSIQMTAEYARSRGHGKYYDPIERWNEYLNETGRGN